MTKNDVQQSCTGDDVEFVAGEVHGLRQWQIVTLTELWELNETLLERLMEKSPPALVGHFNTGHAWKLGDENVAVCRKDHHNYFIGTPSEKSKKTCAGIADPACTCGFYAYNTFSALRENNSITSLVTGLIKAYGRVTEGTKGLRAEKMKIVALTANPECYSSYYAFKNEKLLVWIKRAATRAGISWFDKWDDFVKFANANGIPVDEPEKPRYLDKYFDDTIQRASAAYYWGGTTHNLARGGIIFAQTPSSTPQPQPQPQLVVTSPSKTQPIHYSATFNFDISDEDLETIKKVFGPEAFSVTPEEDSSDVED